MSGFNPVDYRRIWIGLLSGLFTSVIMQLLMLELLARSSADSGDGILVMQLLRIVWVSPQRMREVIWLADALRTVLRFLTAIPVIAGLTGVLAASRHYQSARDLYLIRFVCDAVFAFISVLLLTLDNRDILMPDMAEESSDMLRGFITVLDLASYLVIGFTASVKLLRGMEDTLLAVGEEKRCPGLRRMRYCALILCALMVLFGAAMMVFLLLGMNWPSAPILICFIALLLLFAARLILRALIASEMRETAKIIREISQ